MSSLIARRVRVVGDSRLVDVHVDKGRIAAVGRALDAQPGTREIDLDGRWLMPGLWDAHVHFTQWARFRSRIDVSSATSAREAVAILTQHPRTSGELVIARGFQDALWPDAPTAGALEFGGAPVAVVSHDLHAVWLNDAAAAKLGAPHSGLLREQDAFDAQIAMNDIQGDAERLVADAARAAAARGVVGIRDLEMADNPPIWANRVARGVDQLRVVACLYPQHLEEADGRGWTAGSAVPGTGGLVTQGGLKIFADGSLNTRTALTHEPYGAPGTEPSVGHAPHDAKALRALVEIAVERQLDVILHAIGDLAVTRALDAFESSDARGTIEHAQLIRAQDLPRFARLGIGASVQPKHALDDRDVADAVWGDRAERSFAYRSLHDAGATLLLGSDAPVAPLDPWITMAAAVVRTDDHREPWHPEQELTRQAAIAASVRNVIEVGQPADFIAVDHDPLVSRMKHFRAMPVALTVVAGEVTHADGEFDR